MEVTPYSHQRLPPIRSGELVSK